MIPAAALAALLAVNFTGTIPEINLDTDRCSSPPRDDVVRLVGLELEARVTTPGMAGQDATRVEVTCSGSQVRMVVSDPLTRKQLIRSMELPARTDTVASRMVALAIAELVITSWMELTLSSRATGTDGTAQPAAELLRAAQARAERRAPADDGLGYLLLSGQATGPFTGVGVSWGGGLRLGWISQRHFAVGGGPMALHPAVDLDLAGAWTDVNSPLGTIHVSTWSAAPRASLKLRRGRFWLDIGAGGRIGLARLEGQPTDPTSTRGSTLAGTWAGPLGYLGVGVLLGRLVIAAGIEGGHALRTVAGLVDDGRTVSLSGNWLSGSLAVGWGQ